MRQEAAGRSVCKVGEEAVRVCHGHAELLPAVTQ